MDITFDDEISLLANYYSHDDPSIFLSKIKKIKPTELKIFVLLTFLGRHNDIMDEENIYSHAGTVTFSINDLIKMCASLGITKQNATVSIMALINHGLISISSELTL